MVTILIALCIPITAYVVGYFTLKGVQLGLKHQQEPKQTEQKSQTIEQVEENNPVHEVFQDKPKEEQENIINEWFYGAESIER